MLRAHISRSLTWVSAVKSWDLTEWEVTPHITMRVTSLRAPDGDALCGRIPPGPSKNCAFCGLSTSSQCNFGLQFEAESCCARSWPNAVLETKESNELLVRFALKALIWCKSRGMKKQQAQLRLEEPTWQTDPHTYFFCTKGKTAKGNVL